jgi:hypothetical protein
MGSSAAPVGAGVVVAEGLVTPELLTGPSVAGGPGWQPTSSNAKITAAGQDERR